MKQVTLVFHVEKKRLVWLSLNSWLALWCVAHTFPSIRNTCMQPTPFHIMQIFHLAMTLSFWNKQFLSLWLECSWLMCTTEAVMVGWKHPSQETSLHGPSGHNQRVKSWKTGGTRSGLWELSSTLKGRSRSLRIRCRRQNLVPRGEEAKEACFSRCCQTLELVVL